MIWTDASGVNLVPSESFIVAIDQDEFDVDTFDSLRLTGAISKMVLVRLGFRGLVGSPS